MSIIWAIQDPPFNKKKKKKMPKITLVTTDNTQTALRTSKEPLRTLGCCEWMPSIN